MKVSAHTMQQSVKWVVYTLLLVNWGFYIFEDWDRAMHTLDASSTFIDWAAEFATSIDESAWFILLFLLELETYWLADRHMKPWLTRVMHTARIVCFAMIFHTLYAFTNTVIDYQPTVEVENGSSLCDLVDREYSYVYNLNYTEISAESCAGLSNESRFYMVGSDPVVATLDGLKLERSLAWADLVEVVCWLLIILAIEVVVRLQDRGVTQGRSISFANRGKYFCYFVLAGLAAYWGCLSHWLYTWDTFVWIGGFAAIEMNLSEWRDEIEEGVPT